MVTATVAAVVSLTPPAWCAAADESTAVEAKRHYEEGTKAFNLGEFARAIAEFKATYNVKPDPLLLFNIAQSYRLAGDASQALFFYKSFLRNMPAATNRKDVEAQIRRLERQVDEQKREPAVVPPASGAVSPPPAAVTPAPSAVDSPSPSRGAITPAPASPSLGGVSAAAPARAHPELDAVPPAAPPAATQVDLTTQPAPEPEADRPIYKKWWFWAGAAGAVVIIGSVAAANAKKGPSTSLGLYDPKFE